MTEYLGEKVYLHFVFNLNWKIACFHGPVEKELLKTLWEKEKLLVNSSFSFFHNVFESLFH